MWKGAVDVRPSATYIYVQYVLKERLHDEVLKLLPSRGQLSFDPKLCSFTVEKGKLMHVEMLAA